MAQLRYVCRASSYFNGQPHALGDLDTRLVTLSSEIAHEQEFSVANNTTQEIFDVDDDIGSFEVLMVESTQDVWIQLVIDDDGDNGEKFVVFKLRANFPWAIPMDDAQAGDGTVDSFDGTSDVIERVSVRNVSGSTAKVQVMALA